MSYQQVLFHKALQGQPVRRFLDSNPITVSPETSLRDLIENYVYRYNFKTFPIVADGHLLGCVTLERLKHVPPAEWDQRTAENVASLCEGDRTVAPETDAATAVSTMNRLQANRLMVVDHEQFLGTVSLATITEFLARKLEFDGSA